MGKVYTDTLIQTVDSSTFFTIPGDERWVIRQTGTWYGSSTPQSDAWALQTSPGDIVLWVDTVPTAAGVYFSHADDLRVVLIEGTQYLLSNIVGADVSLYGYKLSLP